MKNRLKIIKIIFQDEIIKIQLKVTTLVRTESASSEISLSSSSHRIFRICFSSFSSY